MTPGPPGAGHDRAGGNNQIGCRRHHALLRIEARRIQAEQGGAADIVILCPVNPHRFAAATEDLILRPGGNDRANLTAQLGRGLAQMAPG